MNIIRYYDILVESMTSNGAKICGEADIRNVFICFDTEVPDKDGNSYKSCNLELTSLRMKFIKGISAKDIYDLFKQDESSDKFNDFVENTLITYRELIEKEKA